jgi:hypothetical protein
MKKYLLATLGSLFLLGGVPYAQDAIAEDQIVLKMDSVELPKEDGKYLLITDGSEATEYIVVPSIESSPDIDLCLYEQTTREGVMFPEIIQGNYPEGTYTVSPCNEGETQPSVDLLILTDTDGDGLVDDRDPCPESDRSETVNIEGCDYGVANKLFDDGCTISDRIAECASEAANHGEFVSCVTQYTNGLKSSVLSGAEKGDIQGCAAQSSIGILPCSEPGCEEGSGLGQNRHRARYDLTENDLVIPCVEIEEGVYLAVDMDLMFAASNNFHFKVKKVEAMNQTQVNAIEAPEECAQYDLASNSLIFPYLDIAGTQYQVQMKLLGANSVNFHFKLQSITEVEE